MEEQPLRGHPGPGGRVHQRQWKQGKEKKVISPEILPIKSL
jgi:hypothetical protein